MTSITAFLLGIIQGLTEFLPVSSSGHLELAKAVFTANTLPAESLLMTVVLHGATAMSTIVVFRKTILELLQDLVAWEKNTAFYFAVNILISMLPAAVVGLFMEDLIASLFADNVALVGGMLLFTAVLLYLADQAKASPIDLTPKSALVIGIIQAVAILPGISRSGATIATAVLLGIDKEKAARFSFLMVIPLIFGSMAKSLLDYTPEQNTQLLPLAIGFVAAFLTGIIACQWMLRLVKKAQLRYFSYYCLAVGILALTWSLQK